MGEEEIREEAKPPRKGFLKKFKENWNKTDVICESCGNIKVKQKGLTKQNLKNLFWRVPSLNEWITLLMIAMIIFMSWAYSRDIEQARYFVDNIDQICAQMYARPANSFSNLSFNQSILAGYPGYKNITFTNYTAELNATNETGELNASANVTTQLNDSSHFNAT